jgi:hypothetical protein
MPITADIIWSTIDEAKAAGEAGEAKSAGEAKAASEARNPQADPLVSLIRSHHKFWRFLIIQDDHMHNDLYVDDARMEQIEETLYNGQFKDTKALGANSDQLTERYINTYVKFAGHLDFMRECIREWIPSDR